MFERSRRTLLLTTIVLICAVVGGAQGPVEKVDTATLDKIKEEGLKNSQVMETLSYLTDVYGPRLTGSPNVKIAEDWAVKKLTQWGLENAHLEPWGPFGRAWSLTGFTANVTSPQFIPLIAYPKAWSPSTNGTIRGQAVYFDAKTEEELAKFQGKLKDAIVLLSSDREIAAHFKPEGSRQTDEQLLRLADADPPGAGGGQRGGRGGNPAQQAAAQLAAKKFALCVSEGAGVVLDAARGDGGTMFVQSVSMAVDPNIPFNQRPRYYTTEAPKNVPQVSVASESYNRIIRMIEKGVPVKLEVNIAAELGDSDEMSNNVIAEIPGTDLKDEVVMVGGHFDSWHSGTGATDNAAGSAVAMEVMRILQTLGIKPRRTIRIGLWTGEEQGLLGSRAYVTQHFGERMGGGGFGGGRGGAGNAGGAPPAPPKYELTPEQEKVSGYFNLDNGTGKVRGIYLQGNEAVREIFRAWLAPFREMGASTITISNTGGTDHQSFDGVGIPGFQFIQDEIEYSTRTHHSNMDVYDRIQADDMKQASVIIASFVYNTAMRDEKLPRKPLNGEIVRREAK